MNLETGCRHRKIGIIIIIIISCNRIEREASDKSRKKTKTSEGGASEKVLLFFRNDRRKQRGGFENFWRRLIAPTGNRVVVGGRGRRSGVVLSVATVPIRWRL